MELTGPIPESVTSDLEALKWRLAAMAPSDLPEEQAEALRTEISAIRQHLKRLAHDREQMRRGVDRLQ